ncbi:hypothetical protein [Inhella sp.]|uniref:hypothetical protein n=1 Tax=Inhella sp. TaxID=1921806 RepID=UPI0035AF7E16
MRAALLTGLVAAPLLAGSAQADPGYYLITPYAMPGEAALDLRYWTVKADRRKATLWPEAGLRLGLGPRWTSTLFLSGIGPALQRQRLSSINWAHNWVLSEGRSDWDFGLHAQAIHRPGEGNALEWGPLLQTDQGLTRLNLNLLFERDFATGGTQLKLQGQALHRFGRGLRAGLQGFGELGRWNRLSERPSLRAGPVLRLGLGDAAELQMACLRGKTYGRTGAMFSTQLLLSL